MCTALVSSAGELFVMGDNSEGQLGVGIDYKTCIDRPVKVHDIREDVIQVSCGYRHCLVLTENG
jgi:alpha-tubulin suppressor-like RCC1 family protein